MNSEKKFRGTGLYKSFHIKKLRRNCPQSDTGTSSKLKGQFCRNTLNNNYLPRTVPENVGQGFDLLFCMRSRNCQPESGFTFWDCRVTHRRHMKTFFEQFSTYLKRFLFIAINDWNDRRSGPKDWRSYFFQPFQDQVHIFPKPFTNHGFCFDQIKRTNRRRTNRRRERG